MKIDFIAYHDLQAICGESVFEALSKRHDCRWLIGPWQRSDADAIVMLDHCPHHPEQSARFKFHLPHDMAEIHVYKMEESSLQSYSAVFCPTGMHLFTASMILLDAQIISCSWPKYDGMVNPKMNISLPDGLNVLYAPTSAETEEWKEILPWLFNIGASVIVKNHIYVNSGSKFPPGKSDIYKRALKEADAMEDYTVKSGGIILPRKMNICEVFKKVDIVISDTSSVLVEAEPFCLSIETGRITKYRYTQEVSNIFPNVMYIRTPELIQFRLDELIERRQSLWISGYDQLGDNGAYIAECICKILDDELERRR